MASAFARTEPFAVPDREAAGQASSDETLLQSIAAGDKHALKMLFARHNVRLYRFLLGFVKDESTAEELANEVFLDVWRKSARYEGRSQVSTWLLAIGRHKALSALRRRPIEQLDEEAAERVEDPTDNPEVTMQTRQRSEILLTCLTQLPPAHREIIDLVYYHEKSIEEVAEIICIPRNTVKTRMFYARNRLAKLLDTAGLDSARRDHGSSSVPPDRQ
jgi:RNA polymerase sigma-70 factor (ECF subfamily)